MQGIPVALECTFWTGVLAIAYVYWGYGHLLTLLSTVTRARPEPASAPAADLSVTLLLTVHNEERHIQARLDNLLAANYPRDLLQIIVVSDGSTDGTDAAVSVLARSQPIELVRTERVGKSAAQNRAIHRASGQVVILTDAQTEFDRHFIRAVTACFSDGSVGCVTGNLRMKTKSGPVAASQGYYWDYELRLRSRESDLGILCVASGQAMAVRRELWTPLPPFSGDDCILPLAVVAAGRKVVLCRTALAYDSLPSGPSAEFSARVRMTMRNWSGTWLYPSLLNPLRAPGYALALWSHKLLRWLGPFLIVAMIAAAAGLCAFNVDLVPISVLAAGALVAALGYVTTRYGKPLPIAGVVYAFVLANLGFMVGVLRAASGDTLTSYRNETDRSG